MKELVYLKLRDALIDHEFAPGESLREIALSERYGVSKTPIREALVRLERDGLVETAPYRGARARLYTPEDAREFFEVRVILECECVRLAGRDRALVAALRRNVERTASALRERRDAAVSAALDEFDEVLFSALDNALLAEVVERLSLHLRRLGKVATGQQRATASLEEHRRVVEALERDDVETAQATLREHLSGIAAAQAAALAEYDGDPR